MPKTQANNNYIYICWNYYHYNIIADWEISFFSTLSGVKDDVGAKSIDEMNPSTKEEFVELSQLIVGKLSNYEVTVIHCEVLENSPEKTLTLIG